MTFRPAPALRFDALVLAGSRGAGDPVATAGGKSCKALVEVGGRPMLSHVLDALRASGRIGRISVALDAAVPIADEAPELAASLDADGVTMRQPEASPCATVRAAFAARTPERPLLVATGDHPLLTDEMLRAFCAGAEASGADVSAAVAPTRLLDAAFPGVRRTALRFRDGGYSGCNLFALMGPTADNVLAFWQTLEQERKKPWRMARRIGPGTLAAYLLRRLTLDAAVARLGRRVDARLAAVQLNWAEAARDVDRVEDLEIIQSVLARRADGSPAQ
jgi:GTP:adenosylcobinamide-phosphate guanylyltransferase